MNRASRDLYVDGHVHLYKEYEQARFFHGSLRLARSFRAPLLLLLAESEGHSYFRLLRDHIAAPPQADAHVSSVQLDVSALDGLDLGSTGEPSSITITTAGSSDSPVFLISGRQVVSKENLEVLMVGLDPEDELCSTPRGDRSAEDLIECGLRSGAIVILPWGFGKWIGSRAPGHGYPAAFGL